MAGSGRGNSDIAVAAALAGGATIAEAARRTSVSERTIYRRLAEPGFREQVTEIRAEMFSQGVGRLVQGMSAAAATLTVLLDKSYAPSIRLGASRAILELGPRLRESEELVQRLDALEQRFADQAPMSMRSKRWPA